MQLIEVKDLTKRYGQHTAVANVSFMVEEGEIFGILGRNGAGKTTTVECIAGLNKPDGGTVRVLGLDPYRDKTRLHQQVGVQLQNSELPEQIKVWEALDFYSSFYPNPLPWRKLGEGLGLSQKYNTPFSKLSGGQKQRLLVALALIGNPKIAILDELTTGLDPQARRDCWQLLEDIRARGVTIVLVTHFMEEAERLCDRLALFDAGQIVALDTPAGLTAHLDTPQRIQFRPSVPIPEHLLTDLPEVQSIEHKGTTLIVNGSGNLLQAVTAVLARHQIIAHELRVEQGGLDEVFIALTGHKLAD